MMESNRKVFLFAVLPMLLAMLITILLVNVQTRKLSDRQAYEFKQSLLDIRKNELVNYTNLAFSAIDHLYGSPDIDQGFAKERVKEILTNLEYSEDGYFYAYTDEGTNVVHPKQSYRIGENYWDLKDTNGKPVIQELIRNAQNGGGYTQYNWDKPSVGITAEKLGYSRLLDNWNWMIGTGMYTDDLDKQVVIMKAAMDKHIKNTSFVILSIALISAGLIFISNLFLQFNERKVADNKLKALTKRVMNTQDEERRRVSRELHDGISQSLVAIKYYLEEAGSLFEQKDSDHARLVDKSNHYLGETMQEVRRISRDLHPSILDDKTALYRVTQEALTNIERHANATAVDIRFSMKPDWFEVQIKDNGVGFNVDDKRFNKQTNVGIGLRNMTERLSYFKGRFDIHSSKNGTTLIAAIPKKWITSSASNLTEVLG